MHITICYDYGHCYFLYLYHRDTDKLIHQTLLFYTLISSLHGYSVTLNTIILCLVSQLHRFTWVHDLIDLTPHLHEYLLNTDTWLFTESLLHGSACIHTLIVLVFLLHGLLFLLHWLLLLEYHVVLSHEYFLNIVHDYFMYSWYWYETHVTWIYRQLT